MWLLLLPLAYFALLYVGNPTGNKRPKAGTIDNVNCRTENGKTSCDFVIYGLLSVHTIGRFPLTRDPKKVVVDGKPMVLTLATNPERWTLVPE
jgi:hypothetical protein